MEPIPSFIPINRAAKHCSCCANSAIEHDAIFLVETDAAGAEQYLNLESHVETRKRVSLGNSRAIQSDNRIASFRSRA